MQREFQTQFPVLLTFLNHAKLALFDYRFAEDSSGTWFQELITLRKLCSIAIHKNRLSGCQNLSFWALFVAFLLLLLLSITPEQELFSGI